MKQDKLNEFLVDFKKFLETYYSKTFNEITIDNSDNFIDIIISGNEDSILNISSHDCEITIGFGETHSHIDNYDEPCDFDEIYKHTIQTVFDILNCVTVTYSCHNPEREFGGGSYNSMDGEAAANACMFPSKSETKKLKSWGMPTQIHKISRD